jgi:transcriptional regulator with XRE-family HTH domain
MPHETNVVSSLGADIRSLRKSRKLTLVDMAEALDRSVGWLSQVERGMSRPRMTDLTRIANTLDVEIASFMQMGELNGEDGFIVRADARRPIGSRTEGMIEGLISPDLTDDFEMIHSSFAPHS